MLQLSKLEILDLSRNKLTSIPEDVKSLTSLKFLAVARNRITRLPLALGEMHSLGKLKFDENPLEFPPSEVYKLSPERSSAHETERDKEICQKVKRFLRATAVKQKLRAFSEEDLRYHNTLQPYSCGYTDIYRAVTTMSRHLAHRRDLLRRDVSQFDQA